MARRLAVALCIGLLIPPVARADEAEEPRSTATVRRLTARLRPIQERLREDERLRAAQRVVGLGVAAYGLLDGRARAPVTFVGTQALRLGLHRELERFRVRSGFTVEPTIGRRTLAITFRRPLD